MPQNLLDLLRPDGCPHERIVADSFGEDGSIDGRCDVCGEAGFPIRMAPVTFTSAVAEFTDSDGKRVVIDAASLLSIDVTLGLAPAPKSKRKRKPRK